MEKIAIITDSAPLLNPEYIKKHHIFVLPLLIVFEDASFKEVDELSSADFYARMKTTKKHPKTSQPAFGDQIALYEQLKEEGYTGAVAIHATSKLSGTYNSAVMAVNETGFNCEVIDSKTGSYPMQLMIEKAVELREEGLNAQEIAEGVRPMLDKSNLFLVPASLDQLHKSGRVSGTASLLSNLLNIKLIIGFERDGTITLREKVRSEKKARKTMLSFLESSIDTSVPRRIGIIHCNVPSEASEFASSLQESYPNLTFELTDLTAAVGVHAGEGTIGIAWFND